MLDLTTLWAWLQKNKRHTSRLLLAVIIFAVGWQTGKVMSPYYAASPIVFEDRSCAGQASSGGSLEELQALQKEGIQQASGNEPAGKTPSSAEASEGKPGVKETAAAKTNIAGATQKLFVGSVNSNLYHHKDCSSASRIKLENQLWFSTQEEAEAAGYSPSKCTRDKLGL